MKFMKVMPEPCLANSFVLDQYYGQTKKKKGKEKEINVLNLKNKNTNY